MPNARFFFSPGSGGVLWLDDDRDWETYGHPVDPQRLPVSQDLRDELQRLADVYDTNLNREYPPHPGPWREAECELFNAAVHATLDRLRRELRAGWLIVSQFDDLHEDPDLDRYLADPVNFRR